MKLDTFFEKFDQFADAPDAVGKMRELVFQLAVQGRLVQQDRTEESTTVLLKRIRAARAELPTNRRSIDETDTTELEEESTPVAAPSGWTWTSLGNVQVFTNGYAFKSEDYQSSGVGIIRMGELGANGEIDERNMKYVANEIAQSLPETFRVRPGDLLMGMSGSIGKLAINRSDKTYLLNQRVGRLEPLLIEKAFLHVFLKTVEHHYLRISFGMAIKNLSTKQINETPFPLPPLGEQKRIVAKVDELMALCDRLEAQQQERETRHAALARASLARFAEAPTPASLPFLFHPSYAIPPADLRKSILTLAVQGKLVPQDPNDEPAEKCFSRLGLKSTFVPPEGDDFENDSLPPAWARVRFEDIALVAGGVTLGRKLGDRKTVNLPYLRVANVKRGEIDLSVIKEVSIAEDEIERYALRENDLLMTEGGDWDKVGRAAIWKAEIPVCLHQNHVFRARMRSAELASFWFERYFNSPVGRGYFESASKQTTNLASINMRQVRSCPIPLPPLAEQRRIVAKVEQLMALVDALETQLVASRATATNLLSALVAELTKPIQRPVARKVFEPQEYLIQLIPALLRAVGDQLALAHLNATIALLVLPKQFLPLIEANAGMKARRHFETFAQKLDAGSVNTAIQLLAQIGTINHTVASRKTTYLHLNLDKLPPIHSLIDMDASYLASIINLIPLSIIEEKTAQTLQESSVEEITL